MDGSGMGRIRHLNRRHVLQWGAAATGMLALDAATGGAVAQAASLPAKAHAGQKVTVVVAESGTEILPSVIDRWNKAHPSIELQMAQVTTAQLAAELASGTAPDVIRLPGAGELANYVVRGVAMDITSHINGDKKQYPPNEFENVDHVFQYNGSEQGKGRWYGMPKDWSQDYMIWYNKDVFSKAGIPALSADTPVTWPHLFSLAKELTGSGRFGLGYYAALTQLDGSLLLLLMAQKGLKAWSNDHTKAKFNQDGVKEIIQEWTTQVVKPNVGPNSVNGSTASYYSDFPTGKFAMIICGYWYSGAVRQAYASAKDSLAMVPAPVTPGGKRLSPTGAATGAIINAHTKHPKETWEVFSYLYGKDYGELVRAQSGWGLPTFSTRWNDLPQGTAWDKGLLAVQKRELKYFGIIDYNPYLGLAALNAAMASYINPVYFGHSTVNSAVQQLEDSVNHTIQSTMRSVGR